MKKVNAVRPKNENNFLRLLLSLKLAEYKIAAESFSEIVFFLVQYSFLFEDTEKVLNSCDTEQSQLYALQENRDLGARYLDPKYSRWISADPAMNTGEYFPVAPVDDEAKKHNGNLPGMGGVFNTVNFNLYHYAGNNPIKYFDPDGRETKQFELKLHVTGPELEKFVLAAVRTNTHIQNGYSVTDALVPLTNGLNGIAIIDSIIAAGTNFAFGESTSLLNPYVALGITGLGILAEFCINNSNKAEAEKNFKKIAEFYTEVMDLYDSGFYFADELPSISETIVYEEKKNGEKKIKKENLILRAKMYNPKTGVSYTVFKSLINSDYKIIKSDQED